ncbi:MAG: tetratricopeptide repeat protein [Xanthomonadales bacterium]|nr:tetratricopeptide repeat protein [Xanthomonadales bacterium]
MNRRIVRVGALIALLWLNACAVAPPPPAPVGYQPTDVSSDEAGLWAQMVKIEESLASSPARVNDPELQRYLNDVSCKVAPDYCEDLRIYLIREPYFNAAMYPNGVMLVWTGLLLRVEDEAQLAFVLGHELSHFRHRDTLARWRQIKRTENVVASLSVAGGAFGAGLVGVAGAVSGYAALFAYGRDLERQADRYGLERIHQAGYDPSAPGRLWQSMWEEDRVRDKALLSGIFATHPATEERASELGRQGAELGPGSDHRSRYQALIAPWRGQWLDDELGRRHYAQSEVLLRRLLSWPEADVSTRYALAELYRLRAAEGDLQRALSTYDEVLALPQAPAVAYRQRAQVRAKLGDPSGAAADYRQFLRAQPEAPEQAMIEQLINQLEGS